MRSSHSGGPKTTSLFLNSFCLPEPTLPKTWMDMLGAKRKKKGIKAEPQGTPLTKEGAAQGHQVDQMQQTCSPWMDSACVCNPLSNQSACLHPAPHHQVDQARH